MKNVLLGVTGSVAATLTPKLTHELFSALGPVQVCATQWGRYFFKEHEVFELYRDVKFWRDEDEWYERCGLDSPILLSESNQPKKWKKKGDPVVHIDLRDWADVLVLAPLTANTMAKIVCGLCDNLLTSVVRAWDESKPVVFAPAMNTHMWKKSLTFNQVVELKQWGWHLVPPIAKELACGDEGEGAMARIEDIVAKTMEVLK